MRNRSSLLVLLGVMIGVGVIGYHSAKALTLVPPSLEYKTAPGQTIDGVVKLINNENRTLVLTPSTANFGAKDETGDPDFKFGAPPEDLASWIKIDTTTVTLDLGETKEIPFKIEVPANADPGGHYAGIFFSSGGTASGGGQIGVQSKLGSLIILTVDGNIREQATIDSVKINGPTTIGRPPVDFQIRIKNGGNVHIKPKGKVTILNMFGGEVESLTLPQDKNVLPGQTRLFEVTWVKNAASAKKGSFFNEISAEFSNFALGTYTANVEVTYGQNDTTMLGKVKFTVIPWRALSVVALGVLIIILLLTFGLKSYNQMVIRKAQASMKPPVPPAGKG